MIEYRKVALVDLCESVTDCPHSTPVWTSSGKLVIRNINIKDGRLNLSNPSFTDEVNFNKRIKRQKPLPGDLIITREAPMGEVCIIPQGLECCLGQRMVLLKPNKNKCNNQFLLYALLSRDVQEQISWNEGTGTTVSNLRIPVLEQLKIPAPSLKDQESIARILSSFDAKIENNNKINENLQSISQLLFKHWFIDFEFPNAEGLPYKSSGGEMVDSELGMIPKGWGVGNLGDIIDFSNGFAFKSRELIDEPIGDCYHVFKMGHIVKGGGINKSGTKSYIEKSKCIGLDKYILKKGDLLMCMTDMKNNVALLGHTALMDEGNKYIVNQRVGLLRVKDKNVINYPYLYILTNSFVFLENLRSRSNSGVQVNLSTREIVSSRIVIPTSTIHKLFNSVVENFYEEIFNIQQENQNLEKLRDTLLPKLMSGEIDLSNQEINQ